MLKLKSPLLSLLLSIKFLSSNVFAIEPQSKALHKSSSDAIQKLQKLANMIDTSNTNGKNDNNRGGHQNRHLRYRNLSEYMSLDFNGCLSLTLESPQDEMLTFNYASVNICEKSPEDGDTTNEGCVKEQEVTMHLGDYLLPMVDYYQLEQKMMCKTCRKTCSCNGIGCNDTFVDDDDSWLHLQFRDDDVFVKDDYINEDDYYHENDFEEVICDTCVNECQKIENMKNNYYLDATMFKKCKPLTKGHDPPLYVGPTCRPKRNGKLRGITIGVFSDEHCLKPLKDLNVEDYLIDEEGYNYRVSHALLKKTYGEESFECYSPMSRMVCDRVKYHALEESSKGKEDWYVLFLFP